MRRAPEDSIARVVGHFAQILEALVASGQKVFLTSQVHIEATLEAFRDLEQKAHGLETMNARLTELDKLKSVFLATVEPRAAHAADEHHRLLGDAPEGMAGPLAPEQEQYVRTIMDKGETLLRLISSIMDLSPDRGRAGAHPVRARRARATAGERPLQSPTPGAEEERGALRWRFPGRCPCCTPIASGSSRCW